MANETTVPVIAPGKIEWLRILVGAVLAELILFAIAIVMYMIPNGSVALLYIVPPACLAATLFFGYRVAAHARTRFILHGALVGCVAALLYIALTWGRTLPISYLISHFIKVIGGAAGGYLAQRRARSGRIEQ
jgi:putative membrane protein (TIGR04086 family)